MEGRGDVVMIKYSGEATAIQRDDSDGPANEAPDNATGPEHQCNCLRPINCCFGQNGAILLLISRIHTSQLNTSHCRGTSQQKA